MYICNLESPPVRDTLAQYTPVTHPSPGVALDHEVCQYVCRYLGVKVLRSAGDDILRGQNYKTGTVRTMYVCMYV